ncbi:MAG: metallophosphoesterase [Sulfuricellaceae bacterium]
MSIKPSGLFLHNLGNRGLSLAIALACVGNLWCVGNAAAAGHDSQAADPVAFSFAFFGCNRLDKEGVDATQSDSTANVAQLRQSFKDIAKSPRLPNYLFLAGDIVKAKEPGTKKLAKQLSAWVELATDTKKNPLIAKKVPIVTFTGNHELLVNQDEGDCKYAQCPNPPAYAYWQQFMGSNPANFIIGNNGPAPDDKGGSDGLLDDESRLTYSFRSGDVMFVILNTDTQIDKDTIGDVPLNWLKQQLIDGQNDADIHHIFVMGHKPLQSGDSMVSDDTGDRTIRTEDAAAFYSLLNNPMGDGTPTKVRAFLAAHAHEWSYAPKLTVAGVTGDVPQIVAGNGGSPPNSAWKGKNAYFGYTLIEITQSGAVTAKSYGRPIDKPYYNQKTGKATLRENYILYTPAKQYF